MNILKTLKNSYYVPGSDASWIGTTPSHQLRLAS